MPKTKNLRGIPGNLALSYLSTLGYYEDGYMSDWIIRMFNKLEIREIKIDILNEKIFPETATIKPLLSDLPKLKEILNKGLKNNNFDKEFIVKAELNFEQLDKKTLKCLPILEDENGKLYFPKKAIIEQSYE